jgi:hypothetical protein
MFTMNQIANTSSTAFALKSNAHANSIFIPTSAHILQSDLKSLRAMDLNLTDFLLFHRMTNFQIITPTSKSNTREENTQLVTKRLKLEVQADNTTISLDTEPNTIVASM